MCSVPPAAARRRSMRACSVAYAIRSQYVVVDRLKHPIVQAPMAGGPSTVELARAVGDAGGLGFLAAGYLKAAQVRDQIHELRGLTGAPFGVNVFVPGASAADPDALARYLATLD